SVNYSTPETPEIPKKLAPYSKPMAKTTNKRPIPSPKAMSRAEGRTTPSRDRASRHFRRESQPTPIKLNRNQVISCAHNSERETAAFPACSPSLAMCANPMPSVNSRLKRISIDRERETVCTGFSESMGMIRERSRRTKGMKKSKPTKDGTHMPTTSSGKLKSDASAEKGATTSIKSPASNNNK